MISEFHHINISICTKLHIFAQFNKKILHILTISDYMSHKTLRIKYDTKTYIHKIFYLKVQQTVPFQEFISSLRYAQCIFDLFKTLTSTLFSFSILSTCFLFIYCKKHPLTLAFTILFFILLNCFIFILKSPSNTSIPYSFSVLSTCFLFIYYKNTLLHILR